MELRLRNEMLRIPIGMNLFDEDLSNDKDDYHIGAFDSSKLIGCLLLSKVDEKTIKMRQVAVDGNYRKMGIGTKMVDFSEKFAKKEGFSEMTLHARREARGFYTKLGYETIGEEFEEVGIPHFEIQKPLLEDNITIRRVNESNITEFSSILIEAAQWMIANGFENWDPKALTEENISDKCSIGELYICYVNDKPAGCLKLQEKDEIFWPEYKENDALYIHKLAVGRAYSGKGIAPYMIDWAKKETKRAGRKYLRLDCIADRKRLCDFYERNGFLKVDEVDVIKSGSSARYEFRV